MSERRAFKRFKKAMKWIAEIFRIGKQINDIRRGK